MSSRWLNKGPRWSLIQSPPTNTDGNTFHPSSSEPFLRRAGSSPDAAGGSSPCASTLSRAHSSRAVEEHSAPLVKQGSRFAFVGIAPEDQEDELQDHDFFQRQRLVTEGSLSTDSVEEKNSSGFNLLIS
mmetsp:Transcript_32815/g.86257  ORF Transcript_32815/g.86257 Transcript_32815/m.86257 type:complete len:129 (+) Transcript_32815:76-462(+)